MGADVLGQIPLFDASGLVATDELALVRMDHYVVHYVPQLC